MMSKIILDNNNLQNNLNFVKEQSNNAKICAMVKANAYGHGLKEIVGLLNGKIDAFGIVNIEEALTIREVDSSTPVILFGKCDDIEKALQNNISLTIISIENLENILKIAKKLQILPKLHLNINSGMNRFGIKSKKDFKKVISILNKNHLQLDGIFTHFSSLTTDEDYTLKQKESFDSFISMLPKKWNPIIHVGGGHSVLTFEGYQMYRVGMFLYGYGDENLRPVLSVKSKIVDIQEVVKGEHIGYMSAFTAEKNMKVASIPLGYDDGVKRGLSNKFHVKINGNSCKNVGNICMDCFMVDISNVKAKIGDEVEIMTNALEWAEILNTSEYEVLTNFNGFRGERVKNGANPTFQCGEK